MHKKRLCKLGEEASQHLIRNFDAVMTEGSRNLGQHHIRREEISNQEVTQILNYLVDLRLVGL